jgi:hypothetical protein
MDKIDAIKVPRGRPRPAPAAGVDRVLAAICRRRPHKDVPLYPALVNLPLSMVHRIGARARTHGDHQAGERVPEDASAATRDGQARARRRRSCRRGLARDPTGATGVVAAQVFGVSSVKDARRRDFV